MVTNLELAKSGDLGNQLFRVAVLLSVGKWSNYEVKIPEGKPFYDQGCKRNIIPFTEGFKTNIDYLTEEDKNLIQHKYGQKSFKYDPDVFNIPDNTDIRGYFQSEKFFSWCREYILENFEFKDEIKERANQILQDKKLDPTQLTAIHVRRGDYKHRQDHHPLLPINYYVRAMSFFSDSDFLIFSDEIEWCKENMRSSHFYFFDSYNRFMDLYVMGLCKNHIIANSSFSWWGHWLSQNSDKKAVAPKTWFGPAKEGTDTSDLYTSTMIKT